MNLAHSLIYLKAKHLLVLWGEESCDRRRQPARGDIHGASRDPQQRRSGCPDTPHPSPQDNLVMTEL
ncbi:hypothetical protein [Prochlorothrix hollandica]|uniref:hypothetical protein n=1 Tax=Prochlorothrix hollandica TaxID=1223 RepID=UPI00034B154A|nr:hypothetical protein [Prochlorothrix hollandica]